MAVTVKTLYNNGSFLYRMNILAGRSGLENIVQWVHIIEDDDVSKFLHGGELVFTAGILNHEEEWLLHFARKLVKASVSAFVVNIGPYTRQVPPSVISFCNESGLPLFTIPWETKMVDMTRDFCHRIMQAEHTENTIMTTMKNILFKIGDMESQMMQMERYGFHRNSRFCFIGVQPDPTGDPEEQRTVLKSSAERMAKEIGGQFVTFTYNECRILVLANCSPQETDAFLQGFVRRAQERLHGQTLYLGVSPILAGIGNQSANFEKALSAMEMAGRRNETIVTYDSLGIYKLLYAVNDKETLRSFHQETVGRLETYDRENGTTLTPLLRDYLAFNGSLQLVSEKQFVHRNTVTNQLRKIEQITGCNPLELDDKLQLLLGFRIGDVL